VAAGHLVAFDDGARVVFGISVSRAGRRKWGVDGLVGDGGRSVGIGGGRHGGSREGRHGV